MANYDPNSKTVRHFQCRDFLWEIYRQMSEELGVSIDYLINEAMRYYAKARNYGVGAMPPQPREASAIEKPLKVTQQIPKPSVGGVPKVPPYPPSGGVRPQIGGAPPPVTSPRPATPPPLRPGVVRPPVGGAAPQQQQLYPSHQVTPSSPDLSQVGAGRGLPPDAPRLYLIFNDQKIPITKQQFIIGRGSKYCDLTIKDGNISRKHAAVIYSNGAYYFKDLKSTNGVEYNGVKIDNKKIEEGDTFYLCGYAVKFTYRG